MIIIKYVISEKKHKFFLFLGETTTTPAPVQPGGGVQPAAQLRVVVNPEVLPVQYGRTVEFTCIVYGGDANTNVYWIQEQPERVNMINYISNNY